MRPFTDEEWNKLPHVIWTNEAEWDPTVLDVKISDKENWFENMEEPNGLEESHFDAQGNFFRKSGTISGVIH